MLKRQIKDLPAAAGNAELAGYAREATELLVQIAKNHKCPLAKDLNSAEPALSQALNTSETGPSAATTLADVPVVDAQRSLADIVLNPSRPPRCDGRPPRTSRNIKQFGPLMSADQEARLASLIRDEDDPDIQAELSLIVRALTGRPGLLDPATCRLGPDQCAKLGAASNKA